MIIDRRTLLLALATAPIPFRQGAALAETSTSTVSTLEAFADTLIPGRRRFAGDRPIAGVVSGPGAVQAGAVDLLRLSDLPLAPYLPAIGLLLNTRATVYALRRGLVLPITWPPLVGLSYSHRCEVVRRLFQPDDPDRPVWQVLSFLTCLAFDAAAHQPIGEALRRRHPGLGWLGFPKPDPDGLWRFPDHSYRRVLALPHPATTPSGSPA